MNWLLNFLFLILFLSYLSEKPIRNNDRVLFRRIKHTHGPYCLQNSIRKRNQCFKRKMCRIIVYKESYWNGFILSIFVLQIRIDQSFFLFTFKFKLFPFSFQGFGTRLIIFYFFNSLLQLTDLGLKFFAYSFFNNFSNETTSTFSFRS